MIPPGGTNTRCSAQWKRIRGTCLHSRASSKNPFTAPSPSDAGSTQIIDRGPEPATELIAHLGDEQPLERTVHVLVGGIGMEVTGVVTPGQQVQSGVQRRLVRGGQQPGSVRAPGSQSAIIAPP